MWIVVGLVCGVKDGVDIWNIVGNRVFLWIWWGRIVCGVGVIGEEFLEDSEECVGSGLLEGIFLEDAGDCVLVWVMGSTGKKSWCG